MTDEKVEKLIMKEIKKRDILFYDMIGIPDHGVDPNPDDDITPRSEKGMRSNRFTTYFGPERMRELLSVGKFNPYEDYPPLKISLQDLFRFWWDRCIEKGLFVDEILGDIFDYFTDKLRPPVKEKEEMDMTLDFGQLPLFTEDMEEAA